METRIAVALLLSIAFSHFAAAQDAPAAPRARADDVAWIAGYWEGEGLGDKIEDIWMPPRDEVLRFRKRAL